MCPVAGTPRSYQITHAGIPVQVTYKDVKHLRLRVLAPEGRVAATVPLLVDERHVRDFIETQSGWILTAQQRVRMAQPVVEPLVDGGRARLWGRWHEVRLREAVRPSAGLDGSTLMVAGRDTSAQAGALESLKRRELEAVMPGYFGLWQARIGREASLVRLRRMKTRWGSCNTRTAAVTLNVALAEYPPEMLEYVIVHELVHLWERGHGSAFTSRMDAHLPDWRDRRAALRGGA